MGDPAQRNLGEGQVVLGRRRLNCGKGFKVVLVPVSTAVVLRKQCRVTIGLGVPTSTINGTYLALSPRGIET